MALEGRAAIDCSGGKIEAAPGGPGREEFEVEADGAALLVVRTSFARGWRARVDGRPTAVFRANGKHKAVPISAGRHRVMLSYHPPGLVLGAVVSALSLLGCALLAVRDRPRGPEP